MSHAVALVNLVDGSVKGHKAGCSDLKRGNHGPKNHADEPWELDVDTKADAWYAYNSDLIAEGGPGNAYDIDWAPCTKRVPEGSQEDVLANLGTEDEEDPEEPMTDLEAEIDQDSELVQTNTQREASKGVTAKVGRKWTYLFDKDGELIAELRNDQLKAIAAYAAAQV